MNTRPTPARVREALFSILGAMVSFHEVNVLDLYAGSGALGIEALSRGASHGVFVERDRNALAALHRNIEPFKHKLQVMPMAANQALSQLQNKGRRFEIIFLDPPYAQNLLEPTLANIARGGSLAQSGVVVCEHHSHSKPPAAPPDWALLLSRAFGDVTVSLYGYAEGLAP